MVYVAINSDVVDNKCYIPTGMKITCYLSYLTFDTTSYQSLKNRTASVCV